MLFDSHAHWDDDWFDEDRDALIQKVHESGVGGIMNVGADLDGCYQSVALAKRFPFFYAAVGIHPGYAGKVAEDYLDQLRALAKEPKVHAIGEIGLDYHYEGYDKEAQFELFHNQLKLAEELDLPVIIHDREAHGDCLKFLEQSRVGGVMHCYSGSAEMAKVLVKRGFYIAFGGTLTYKNARQVLEAAVVVPKERLLIETDSPYLAPVPHRGERNHSGHVRLVAEKLAEIRGVSYDEIVRLTDENARRCFRI